MENLNETIAKVLEQTDLFWNVKTVPLVLDNQVATPTDYVATQREDNGEIFGVFKDGYSVFQNWEMVELVQRVADREGLEIKSGGHFKGGARVYLQLDSSTINGIGKNKDTVKNYISAINTFDGSSALKWGNSNLVISCSNTFWAVQKKLANSIRHTTNMKDNVEFALRELEGVREMEKMMIDTFWKMSEIAMTETAVRKVIKLATKNDISKMNDLPTVTQNKIISLTTDINSEVEQKGATLWGLFNGLTKWTTHHYGSEAGREMAKAFGVTNAIDNKVYSTLEEFAS